MQEVMCLILNKPIRFEPHTLVQKSGQSVQTYFSLPLAPLTGNKEKYGWLMRLNLVSHTRPSGRRKSGQIPIRLWCCILSSRVLNEVGVNTIGTCSKMARLG